MRSTGRSDTHKIHALFFLAEVRIAMYCDGPTGIKAAVRQKMGVGVALTDSIKSELASGEFKILKVPGLELVGQSYVVYSKKRPLSAIAVEFLEMLRNERAKVNAKKPSSKVQGSKVQRQISENSNS